MEGKVSLSGEKQDLTRVVEGDVIKSVERVDLYVLRNHSLQIIPDWSAFLKLCVNVEEIKALSPADFAALLEPPPPIPVSPVPVPSIAKSDKPADDASGQAPTAATLYVQPSQIVVAQEQNKTFAPSQAQETSPPIQPTVDRLKAEKEFFKSSHRLYMSHNIKISTDKGILMCISKEQTVDIARMIWLLRRIWKSELGFGVVHCDEIRFEEIALIQSMDPSVHVINLCEKFPAYGMQESKAQWKLRGHYCKLGALLASPFAETMLVDATVVWLKPPSLLFSSPSKIEKLQ